MTEHYLPIGCFGKLPFYGDFLEANVSFATSRALRQWIREGRSHAGLDLREKDQDVRGREANAHRFLYGPSGSADLAVGVIRPSVDKTGRRDYPFMVFTHLSRRYVGRSFPLLPLALAPVWDALDDVWDGLSGVVSEEAFHEVLSSTLVPAPAPASDIKPRYEDKLRGSLAKLFDRDDEASLAALLKNLPPAAARLRERAMDLRLEMPVSRDPAAAAFDAAFWVDLLNSQSLWRRFEPSIFLDEPPQEKGYCVLLLFGMIKPSDYPLLMGCCGEATETLRPAHGPPSGGSKQEPDQITYAELLARRLRA